MPSFEQHATDHDDGSSSKCRLYKYKY